MKFDKYNRPIRSYVWFTVVSNIGKTDRNKLTKPGLVIDHSEGSVHLPAPLMAVMQCRSNEKETKKNETRRGLGTTQSPHRHNCGRPGIVRGDPI